MIRYRPSPGGGRAIVEASPADVQRNIPRVKTRLMYRFRVPHRDVPDLAQEVAWITCEALVQERVREVVGETPRYSLMAFMVETAWRLAQNYKRLSANIYEVVSEAPHDDTRAQQVTTGDPVRKIEARETLARLLQYPEIAAFLVDSIGKRPEVPGRGRAAGYFHLARFRRWLREVHDSGVWTEPPQPIPPDPRDRKKGR